VYVGLGALFGTLTYNLFAFFVLNKPNAHFFSALWWSRYSTDYLFCAAILAFGLILRWRRGGR
jgi:hypothetical protein